MTPVKRNQTWMPNLFNDFWSNDWFNILPARKSSNLPAMNIIENDNCFKIELAVPGITKEDFQISITNDNELVISVNKKMKPKKRIKTENIFGVNLATLNLNKHYYSPKTSIEIVLMQNKKMAFFISKSRKRCWI